MKNVNELKVGERVFITPRLGQHGFLHQIEDFHTLLDIPCVSGYKILTKEEKIVLGNIMSKLISAQREFNVVIPSLGLTTTITLSCRKATIIDSGAKQEKIEVPSKCGHFKITIHSSTEGFIEKIN